MSLSSLPPSLHLDALLFPAQLLSQGVSSALLFTALHLLESQQELTAP